MDDDVHLEIIPLLGDVQIIFRHVARLRARLRRLAEISINPQLASDHVLIDIHVRLACSSPSYM